MLLQGFDHIASIRIVKADITRDRVGLERQTNEGHSPTCTGHFFSREISWKPYRSRVADAGSCFLTTPRRKSAHILRAEIDEQNRLLWRDPYSAAIGKWRAFQRRYLLPHIPNRNVAARLELPAVVYLLRATCTFAFSIRCTTPEAFLIYFNEPVFVFVFVFVLQTASWSGSARFAARRVKTAVWMDSSKRIVVTDWHLATLCTHADRIGSNRIESNLDWYEKRKERNECLQRLFVDIDPVGFWVS